MCNPLTDSVCPKGQAKFVKFSCPLNHTMASNGGLLAQNLSVAEVREKTHKNE